MKAQNVNGFTLLEVLIVVAVLSLIAGLASFRLHLPYQQARLAETTQRLAFLDQQVRVLARHRRDNVSLVFDLDENTVYAESEREPQMRHLQCAIPLSVRCTAVRLVGRLNAGGSLSIPVTADGRTRSYAVRLQAADSGDSWLFFAGLSGQMTQLKEESDVVSLFATLSQGRTVAH